MTIVAFIVSLLTVLNAAATTTTSNASKVGECVGSCTTTSMCTLPNGDSTAGIYYARTPDIKTKSAGVFTVDANNGDIYYCDVTSHRFLVATPPIGYAGQYSGLGGWDSYYNIDANSSGKLTLVETSTSLQGMLFCFKATILGCGKITWVSFPRYYCSKFQNSECTAEGTVLDSNLNVYWVDPVDSVLTECLAPRYHTCRTLVNSSEFEQQTGQDQQQQQQVEPWGLAYVNGTAPYETPGWQLYIADASCEGNVWVVTDGSLGSQLSLVTQINDSLSGIGSSTRGTPNSSQQIFVADTGRCTDSSVSIVDISPSPVTIAVQQSTAGQTMFLSTCVGQCLGYPEGSRASGSVSDSENMFFSLGSETYSTDEVAPLTKVPVSLSFTPKNVTDTPGTNATNTLSVTNKGTTSITFTECALMYLAPASAKYEKGRCSLNNPVTLSAGERLKFSWSIEFPVGSTPGDYQIKVIFTNSAERSATGEYTVEVT